MDATLEKMMGILSKNTVTIEEARDGILHCFCVVNRAFMRDGAMEIQEDSSNQSIDRMLLLLAGEVYTVGGGDLAHPSVEGLKRLKTELDDKLQLASKDPVIQRKHDEVVAKLLASVGAPG